MPLDLWIFGSGFGEACVLAWTKPGETGLRAAVIDHLGGASSGKQPVFQRLKQLGFPPLALVAATHPHLDHVRNFDRLLMRENMSPKRIFWWGGHDDDLMEQRYDLLAQHRSIKGRLRGSSAKMSARFLRTARVLAGHVEHDGVLQSVIPEVPAILSTPMAPLPKTNANTFDLGGMTVSLIGPSHGSKMGYVDSFKSQFSEQDGEMLTQPLPDPDGTGANRASLGMVFRYNGADVVLPGDMETASWEDWQKWDAAQTHKLNPKVIKVSHHGSSTGSCIGMWRKGFFKSHDGKTSNDEHPLCIVTPWRRGEKVLPDERVIDEIVDAGCKVVITGSPQGRSAIDKRKTHFPNSHAHVRIGDDGALHFDRKHCVLCDFRGFD